MGRKIIDRYWKEEHEDLLVRFVNSKVGSRERNDLTKLLLPNVTHMANVVIKRYFNNLAYNLEDEISEVVTHVFLNLDKFNVEKGYGFSFVQTIIRNYFNDKYRKSTFGKYSIYYNTISKDDEDSENPFMHIADNPSKTIEDYRDEIYDLLKYKKKTDINTGAKKIIDVMIKYVKENNIDLSREGLGNYIIDSEELNNYSKLTMKQYLSILKIKIPIELSDEDKRSGNFRDTSDMYDYRFDDYTSIQDQYTLRKKSKDRNKGF